LGVIVAADEEPCFASGGDPAVLALGAVVRHLESAVLEEAGERVLLVARVAERGAQ